MLNTERGQVVIINTLLFFAISTAIIFAVTYPVVSSYQTTKSFLKSKQAFMVANSASSEAIYRLNSNMDLSSETITLAQGTADIVVSDAGTTKTVRIDSDVEAYERNYEIVLSQGEGVSFSYGLQVGQGGFIMENNSTINGNVYANGDIIGSNGATVTGTAVAANVSNPSVGASNTGIVDPLYSQDFGGNSAAIPQDVAQSFTVSTTTPVSAIRILVKKTGTPSDFTLRLKSNTGSPGSPSTATPLASVTVRAATVTSSYGYLSLPLSATVSLTPGTTYWIVLDATNYGSGKYYTLGANDSAYSGGVAKIAANGSTWAATSPATRDLYFDVYVGGDFGLISNIVVGGDAWANTVNSSNVTGTIYCQGSTGNNKACDASRPDPVQQAWPVSDANILEWKGIATAGGATTTLTISGGSPVTIDPVMIDGDLTLTNGATLYINGTIYVTGNISLSVNSQIMVNPVLGSASAIVVTDGRVSISNGAQLNGTGTSGSYLMVVTTSTCPNGTGCSGANAIDVGNNAGSVILNAQSGTLEFANGASAQQATANSIVMSPNSVVTYQSGLANPSFTTGPSGSWVIDSWKEVE